VALHRALGNDPFVERYGKRRALRGIPPRDVLTIVFPNSRKAGETITLEMIHEESERLLAAWGGEDRAKACAASTR
jgi:hypothetical protein